MSPSSDGDRAPELQRPRWAAVALVLSEADAILLVRRSARPGDPWSGDWAFPGGFGHAGDPDPAATARRETLEEVGVRLDAPSRTLGRRWIFDPWRRRLVRLVPVVFRLSGPLPALAPEPSEVAEARWVPLGALGQRQREWLWVRGRIPWWAAVRRFDGGRIWGLTHAMLDDLLAG